MDEFDQYKPPAGTLCAAGCGHLATGPWRLYTQRNGAQRFDWRCACCIIRGKLEYHTSQIERLTTEYEASKATCGGER